MSEGTWVKPKTGVPVFYDQLLTFPKPVALPCSLVVLLYMLYRVLGFHRFLLFCFLIFSWSLPRCLFHPCYIRVHVVVWCLDSVGLMGESSYPDRTAEIADLQSAATALSFCFVYGCMCFFVQNRFHRRPCCGGRPYLVLFQSFFVVALTHFFYSSYSFFFFPFLLDLFLFLNLSVF